MEKRPNILVVEDEQKIRTALADFLEFHDFVVGQAVDGLQAQRIVRDKKFDLILLDLMLPKISGEGQEKEKIAGLDIGADDYITKPFSLEELLARIKAVLRRTDPARTIGKLFKFGDLDVDISALKVKRNNEEIEISKREAQIIQFFAANPNRVISREELYEKVWGEEMFDLGTRTTDMHIAKLRSKIEKSTAEPEIIKTVRGAGYKYESQT